MSVEFWLAMWARNTPTEISPECAERAADISGRFITIPITQIISEIMDEYGLSRIEFIHSLGRETREEG